MALYTVHRAFTDSYTSRSRHTEADRYFTLVSMRKFKRKSNQSTATFEWLTLHGHGTQMFQLVARKRGRNEWELSAGQRRTEFVLSCAENEINLSESCRVGLLSVIRVFDE